MEGDAHRHVQHPPRSLPADDRVDEARYVGAIATLDADLLALQEVDRNQPRSHTPT